jgi:hypothetical protein
LPKINNAHEHKNFGRLTASHINNRIVRYIVSDDGVTLLNSIIQLQWMLRFPSAAAAARSFFFWLLNPQSSRLFWVIPSHFSGSFDMTDTSPTKEGSFGTETWSCCSFRGVKFTPNEL